MNWVKQRGKWVWTCGRYKVRRVTGKLNTFSHAYEAIKDGQAIDRNCYGYASEARQACERDEALLLRQGGQAAGPEVRT